jgi:putative membrane protein
MPWRADRAMLASMSPVFVIIGSVFAAIAALIHVYIFVLESVTWTKESTRRVFGVRSAEDAELMKPLAYNQGFYNLFLALGVAAGLIMICCAAALSQAGYAVAIFALLSMVLAAVVLITSNPNLARSALIQGAAPLLGLVFLVLGIVSA